MGQEIGRLKERAEKERTGGGLIRYPDWLSSNCT